MAKTNFPELTEREVEFLRRAGKEPSDECFVLSMRITMKGWAPAIFYGDVKWTKRFLKKMKPLEKQPDLVRLKALYVWTLNNPPKRDPERN
jgi:hypothetical protein